MGGPVHLEQLTSSWLRLLPADYTYKPSLSVGDSKNGVFDRLVVKYPKCSALTCVAAAAAFRILPRHLERRSPTFDVSSMFVYKVFAFTLRPQIEI